jgi:hypothetical protein
MPRHACVLIIGLLVAACSGQEQPGSTLSFDPSQEYSSGGGSTGSDCCQAVVAVIEQCYAEAGEQVPAGILEECEAGLSQLQDPARSQTCDCYTQASCQKLESNGCDLCDGNNPPDGCPSASPVASGSMVVAPR